jgi:hypothetical protein
MRLILKSDLTKVLPQLSIGEELSFLLRITAAFHERGVLLILHAHNDLALFGDVLSKGVIFKVERFKCFLGELPLLAVREVAEVVVNVPSLLDVIYLNKTVRVDVC